MANILIIDDQAHRRDCLFCELEKDGYCVAAVSRRDFFKHRDDCLKFDMAIVNLFPDAIATWELHHEFKTRLPDFPVLVYMIETSSSLNSLKSAVKEVLKNHRPCRAKKNNLNRPAAACSLNRIPYPDKKLFCPVS